MSQFQQAVNIYNPPGFVGDLAFTGPIRAIAANLNSSGVAQKFGNAFTFTTAATANPSAASPNGAVAQVGGTGLFAGILVDTKQNVLTGITGNPLGASLALADHSVGELLQMGYCFVNLPGPANPGDLVVYDTATGNLSSVPATVSFTGSIAAGGSAGVADVLTVSAITAGQIYVGMPVLGVGVEGGTTVLSLGTGLGGTGTYNLSTINQQTVASRAMSGPESIPTAFSGTATFATTVMTVATVVSGEVYVGMPVTGAGVPANTVVTSFGTGVGGTGTYNVNQTVGTITPAIAVTGPTTKLVPNCVVERYQADTTGGCAVIKLTN